jgi:hypothetical protein
MKSRIAWLLTAALSFSSFAADSTTQTPDGVITWTPTAPGAAIKGELNASRWGMYDVEAQMEAAAPGKIKVIIGDKEVSGPADGNTASAKLGRVFLDKAGKLAVTISTEPADAAKALSIKALLLTPAPEGKPIVQAEDQSITLHAHDATVHGTTLRYEFTPAKNTLGYWGKESDWVSWDFELKKTGKFIVFVMHGSGGGSEIEIAVGDQKINWVTKNTGGYHTFTFLEAGTLNLEKTGPLTLTLKPIKKVGGAVMDLRQVILCPVLK